MFRLADRPLLPLSAALPLSTAGAATANAGASDAAFVSVSNAAISDTATVSGDFHATVDDGSGPVVVVFDKDVSFNLAPLVPGALLNVWGLLVAEGGGVWVLKPRGVGDVQ